MKFFAIIVVVLVAYLLEKSDSFQRQHGRTIAVSSTSNRTTPLGMTNSRSLNQRPALYTQREKLSFRGVFRPSKLFSTSTNNANVFAVPPKIEKPSMKSPVKIIIAGAPASGKGTQCEVIKEKYGVVHLSTGDILRAAVKAGTPLGLQAKAFMDAGKLVPDELIIGVVKERLNEEDCQCRGWLLDGFPRTKSQADALIAAGQIPDCFILLDVPEEVLVERVTGRRTDPVTGKIYHLKFSPPENAEIAARLVQRSDDTEEKIKVRVKEFQSHISAIRSSYEDRLIVINGAQATKTVSSSVFQHLDQVLSQKHDSSTPRDSHHNPNTTTTGSSQTGGNQVVSTATSSQATVMKCTPSTHPFQHITRPMNILIAGILSFFAIQDVKERLLSTNTKPFSWFVSSLLNKDRQTNHWDSNSSRNSGAPSSTTSSSHSFL